MEHHHHRVLDLVQQGLLPLPRRTLLAARLVCRAWRSQLSGEVQQLTLPHAVWACGQHAAAAATAAAGASTTAAADEPEEDEEDEAQPPQPQPQPAHAGPHALHALALAFPAAGCLTLVAHSSGACDAAALAATVAALAQLPALHTLRVRGAPPAAAWAPLLRGLGEQLPQLRALLLVEVELPPAHVLEGLANLAGLRTLQLCAAIQSPLLEAAHIEALSAATQLEELELRVFQVATGRCPLDGLLLLTRLQSLDVVYAGIFSDQRPALADAAAISCLGRLSSLSSRGLASPLLPVPGLSRLESFAAAGLAKRLPESALRLLGTCTTLRSLRLEGGRRGIAAAACDQLHHLSALAGLTQLCLSLSKGALPAAKSAAQLTQLAALSSLRSLVLGAGDHRLSVATQHMLELAAQWPQLDTLRLSRFAAPAGFAGLGAFTGLTALSLQPGTGTGKLLLELDVALQQLERLRRLHLDFKSGLQLEHVEALASCGPCATGLQHLAINVGAPNVGSKALQAIQRLQGLTSLQLLNVRAANISGPPGIAALRDLAAQRLRLLCIQAADTVHTEQQPLELAQYLAEALQGAAPQPAPLGAQPTLREVRLWLGSGVEARQAEARLASVVEAHLPDTECVVLMEPEKALL